MSEEVVIQLSFGDRELALVRSLRYEILRKPLGMPLSGTLFPGDENESTIHLLALSENELIGCASLFVDDSDAIQLRGMAVASQWQRRGIGNRIVETTKEIAISNGKSLWCNARFPAVGFYERQGWIQSGPFFDIPIVGPHIVMKWTGNSENSVGSINKMIR